MAGTPGATKPHYRDGDRPTLVEEGLECQDLVADLLLAEMGIIVTNYTSKRYQCEHGDNRQGIEIKLDQSIRNSVSIEVAERSAANVATWTPSGIMREDNTWLYVQGSMDIVFVFGMTIHTTLPLAQGARGSLGSQVHHWQDAARHGHGAHGDWQRGGPRAPWRTSSMGSNPCGHRVHCGTATAAGAYHGDQGSAAQTLAGRREFMS